MEIKISIIIAAYNVERFIEKTLRSCIGQTLKEIEIIVINDGSIDSTKNIIEKINLEYNGCLNIVNKENGGISSVRNIGIKMSKGKYILNIDGDDWIESDMCETLYNEAEKYNLDIVISNFFIENINGTKFQKTDFEIDKKNFYTNEEWLLIFLKGKAYPSNWNKIIKKELYENIFFPTEICFGDDLSTIPRLFFKAKKIGKVEKSFYHYIQNMDSITQNNNRSSKFYQVYLALDLIDEALKKNIELSKYEEEFSSYKYYHILNFLMYKPFWKEKKYELAIEKTILELKKNKKIPKDVSLIRKIIINFLKIRPTRNKIKIIINTLYFMKKIREIFI